MYCAFLDALKAFDKVLHNTWTFCEIVEEKRIVAVYSCFAKLV